MNNDNEPTEDVHLSAIEAKVLAAIRDKQISIRNISLLATNCKLTELQVSVAIQLLKFKGKL